jgi:dihydrolipoamide dehydrogenase
MALEIRVPTLGESVSSATVARWMKQPGEKVAADEPVLELETDKVSVEVNAPAAGVLGAHVAAAGAEVTVGDVLGSIDTEGSAVPTSKPPSQAAEPTLAPAQTVPASSAPQPEPHSSEPVADTFDVIVIGGGPGGYVCAIRAAQLGLKTACVEKRETLGGTCLNIGCIPSKALLQSSENFHEVQFSFKEHGILVEGIKLDLARMQARKSEVVSANVKGVEFLFKKNKVTWLKGDGRISATGRVSVDGKSYGARHIVVATGSESIPLAGVTVDEKRIVTSTGALELDKVPDKLVVIGGGYIGLELGSVWHRLGAEVTVVEYLDRLVPGMDGEVGKTFERILGKQGLKFKLGTKVTGAAASESGVDLTVEPAKGGAGETLHADVVLVSIGRRPYTQNLGLDEIGVFKDERGFIRIDPHYRTNIQGIYAIGDVIIGPMLAHKAEEEGVACAELIAGQAGHVNYGVIPGVVYTWPEVASIGATEEVLKKDGVAYNVGKFPFTANGRARAMGSTDGFVKILADKTTDRILGAHIIGPDAGTLIAEIATAMEFGASAEDVARTCHAHPSLNEAVKEAALAVDGRALHI